MCIIMLDDSIISSQPKCNKSLYETRVRRKTKRRNDQSVFLNRDHEQNDAILHNIVNEFYKDSEDEYAEVDAEALNSTCLEAKNSAIIRNFKPFELEKSFAMADRLLPQETKRSTLLETEGFVTCTILNKTNLNSDYTKNINEEQNYSYIITDSELINCCHQAEKILEKGTVENKYNVELIGNELTPGKSDSMVLVNSILEDFSQSPLAKEQIQNTSWQYTPEFRMRRRPVKTYSRKILNSSKANLSQRFEEHIRRDSSECNDTHSSYSSLSIQEDVTLNESLQCQSAVTTGNTQRICENLLNLSEYFTQNQAAQDLLDEQQICFSTCSQENVAVVQNTTDLLNDILALRSIYPNKIRYGSYDSLDDFLGFCCKEYVMDGESNENSGMEANLSTAHEIKVSNILKQSNNPLDDWSEHNWHDEYGCISQQQNMDIKSIELRNVAEHPMPKLSNVSESCRVLEILDENPASSNYAGFKTASFKPIKVSREAQLLAAKILSKLPEIPQFEENDPQNNCDKKNPIEDEAVFKNPEDYEWNDDCDLFLNFKTPMPCKEENERIVEKLPQLINRQLEQDRPSTSKSVTAGFKTAGGKNVPVSNRSKMAVQELLKEFSCDLENDYDYEEELRKIKCKVYAKSRNLETSQSSLSNINEISTHHGVQLPKAKNPTIPMAHQQNVKNRINNEVFLEFENNYNMRHHTGNFKHETSNGIFSESENPSATNSNEEHHILQMPDDEGKLLNINAGFQTANGKNINISAKSKQAVENLFQDFDTISNEHDIMELKTKIQNKRKDLVSKFVEETNEYNKLILDESSRTITNKRKKLRDKSDLESPIRTPPIKTFKSGLLTAKTSFAEKALMSPLSTATHSIILRKNLLSLTKKRKSKRKSLSLSTEEISNTNKNVCDLNMNAATPVKSNKSLTVSAKTPVTPNLNEFFSNAPLTSTPQITNPRKSTQIIEDSDLKPITWNNANDDSVSDKTVNKSMRTRNISERSPLNITLNSSNPTVKERIDRLKMYGKAPAVSPILIEPNRNCRPSGLRRTRSMIKKN